MITQSPFKPIWYLRNSHAQTILANVIHPRQPEVTMEAVTLSDGDRLSLAHGTTKGTHTLLILHGLEGSLHSAYAQRLMHYCNRNNIPAVFMYFRGCDGNPNEKLRSYHSGETSDLSEVIQHLRRSGIKTISLVGYSLGGNVTLKYMGEKKVDQAIVSACAISVPMLLENCAQTMNQGFSRLYQYALLKRLKHKVRQKQGLFDQHGYTHKLKNIRDFVQFDDQFTAPIYGFESAHDYYDKSSSRQFLSRIQKPTLIIHSMDDPFMTTQVIPQESELSEHVELELSSHGGHVGFIGGRWLKPEFWLEQRITKFHAIHSRN